MARRSQYAPARIQVDAQGVAFGVLLTAATTWVLDIEEPAAYAVALLGLLVPPGRQAAFVASVYVASTIVAGVFYAWRELFDARRATSRYESKKGDDRVLVPMRGPRAVHAGRLAADHEAGKVALLDVVSEDWMSRAERARFEECGTAAVGAADKEDAPADADPEAVAGPAARALEGHAGRIETFIIVTCQINVAVGPNGDGNGPRRRRPANCVLIAAPYEAEDAW